MIELVGVTKINRDRYFNCMDNIPKFPKGRCNTFVSRAWWRFCSNTKMTKNQSNWTFSKFWKDGHHSKVLGFNNIILDEIRTDGFWDLTWYILAIVKNRIFFKKWQKNSQIEIFQHFEKTGIIPRSWALIIIMTFDENRRDSFWDLMWYIQTCMNKTAMSISRLLIDAM